LSVIDVEFAAEMSDQLTVFGFFNIIA